MKNSTSSTLIIAAALGCFLSTGCRSILKQSATSDIVPGIDRPFTKLERVEQAAGATGKLILDTSAKVVGNIFDNALGGNRNSGFDSKRLFREGYGYRLDK